MQMDKRHLSAAAYEFVFDVAEIYTEEQLFQVLQNALQRTNQSLTFNTIVSSPKRANSCLSHILA